MSDQIHVFTPPVIAHRGASALAPENTLAAFAQAANDGARWFEADVKLTTEGIPIIYHDETLERTTKRQGLIADLSLQDVQTLDAGSWFSDKFANTPVPLLTDALSLALKRDMQVNLEIKPCPGRTRATTMVTIIETSKIWPEGAPPPLISSFDPEALLIAGQMHPDWPRGLLLRDWNDSWHEQVERVNAQAIHVDAKELNRARITQAREANLMILAYTVNDVALAKQMLSWGVNAVFSDNPGEIIHGL